MFGIQHVAPIVQGFLQAQPRVQVRTLFVNRLVHLLDEGMDVAIRIAPLPDSGLTAVQVGALRRLVVASPAYLAQHGRPRHPADLSTTAPSASRLTHARQRPGSFAMAPPASRSSPGSATATRWTLPPQRQASA